MSGVQYIGDFTEEVILVMGLEEWIEVCQVGKRANGVGKGKKIESKSNGWHCL